MTSSSRSSGWSCRKRRQDCQRIQPYGDAPQRPSCLFLCIERPVNLSAITTSLYLLGLSQSKKIPRVQACKQACVRATPFSVLIRKEIAASAVLPLCCAYQLSPCNTLNALCDVLAQSLPGCCCHPFTFSVAWAGARARVCVCVHSIDVIHTTILPVTTPPPRHSTMTRVVMQRTSIWLALGLWWMATVLHGMRHASWVRCTAPVRYTSMHTFPATNT